MFPVPQVGMICVAAVAAAADWRTGHIPNWLTLPVVVVAPIAYFIGYGTPGLVASLIGLFACGLIPYLLFRNNAIGGGDVKLFAALGAIGGLQLGIEAQLFGLGAAAIFGLALIAWRGALRRTLWNALRLATNPVTPKHLRAEVTPEMMTSMRLGVPIFVGTVVAVVAAGVRF